MKSALSNPFRNIQIAKFMHCGQKRRSRDVSPSRPAQSAPCRFEQRVFRSRKS
jgi:hypothetical protein